MKKTIFICLLIAILVAGILAGCKNEGPLSAEDAKQIVIEHSGVEGRERDTIDVHLGENEDGVACFNVYVTIKGKAYTYVVHGMTGEILSITEGGGHSH